MLVMVGNEKIKAEGKVAIHYCTGRTTTYDPKEVLTLCLNKDSVESIQISREDK